MDIQMEASQGHNTHDKRDQVSNTKVVGCAGDLETVDSTSKETHSIFRHWRTFVATVVVALSSFTMSVVIGYSSSAIPDINSHRNPFHLNTINISVLCGIVSLGGLAGQLSCGFFVDKFGRRQTLIFNCVPMTLGWVLIGSAPNSACMHVGRLVTGFSSGVSSVAVSVYVSEISEKLVRGFMCSCYELFINIGFLYVFSFGAFISWNWLAIACAVIPVLNILLLPLVPESPRWLIAHAQRKEAMSALLWLRCNVQSAAEFEFKEIEEHIKKSGSVMKWKEWRNPAIAKPVLIVVGLLFLQQMSGYGVFFQYLTSIFLSAGYGFNPYVQSVVVAIVGIVAAVISGLLVDRAGRRLMLLVSAAVMAFGFGCLASFFTLKHFDVDNAVVSHLAWLPIFGLMVYNVGASLGFGPIPYFLPSELLPLRARSKAGSLSTSSSWFFTFVTSTSFELLVQFMGNMSIFWIFCGISVVGFVYVYVVVPETKGVSLEDTEN